jgi:hypothetical protein
MPCIVSDFPFFGGVGFNLFYCYEIPKQVLVVGDENLIYTVIWIAGWVHAEPDQER